MSNEFYNATGWPATHQAGASSPARAELLAIALGFDKMPALSGNAGRVVRVKSDSSGLESSAAIVFSASGASIVLDAGSAPLPSLSFASDPNTGIYSPGADQVGISTAGSLRMSFGSAGNISIVAPTSGVSLSIGALTGNRSLQAGIVNPLATNNPRLEIWHTEATGTTRIDFSASTGTLAGQFSIAGTNYMTVTSAGGVTIPTPSAGNNLTIGVPFSSGTVGLVVGDTTTNARSNAQIGGITLAIGQQFAANTPEIWSNDTDGLNVGLTASAGAGASLTFWTNLTARHQIGGSGNQIMFQPTSGSTLQVRNNGEADQLVFSTWNGNPATDQFGIRHNAGASRIGSVRSGGSLELMYGTSVTGISINSSGQATVNAPTSGPALTVNRATAGSVTDSALRFPNNTVITWLDAAAGLSACGFIWYDSSDDLRFGTGNTSRMVIDTNGAVTINAPSAGNNSLIIGAVGNGEALILSGDLTNAVYGYAHNIHNSGSVGAAGFIAGVGGASGGDPFFRWDVDSVSFWIAGTDNSVSDNWCLASGTSLGTNNKISVTASGHAVSIADSAGTLYNAGYLEAPINQQNGDYTLVLSDSGKAICHNSGSTHNHTIPANSSVAYPTGTILTFINQGSTGNVNIVITTDTMTLAGSGATGTRTLAPNGRAVAIKLTSTTWQIAGTNLT